jgi:putative transposase
MPWTEVSPMDEKTQFIADVLRQTRSITELCQQYNISRNTAYKLIKRYFAEGPAGLREQSRRPHSCPHRIDDATVALIIDARRLHPRWGAKKLLKILSRKEPHREWPSRATVCNILDRNGLVVHPRNRRKIGHPGKPTALMDEPNKVLCADFKGHFRTGDGVYCYPLTVTDGCSRYLLACRGLFTTKCRDAKPVFRRLFQEYGLPDRIRTDNGVPFATNTLARLSSLSAWWVRLGVMPDLIEPGKPQQNGRHERMHRTLKAETARPPSSSMRSQQKSFDRFREEYNNDRPHEALDQETPASRYRPSSRKMPERIPRLEYPAHFETRYVSSNGGMRWNQRWVNVSTCCVDEYVGLEEIDDGVWDVYFGRLKLGRLLEEHSRIEDQFGRLKRHEVSPMSLD